jgi:membrane-associated protease RseP (regulator of RpoE activity)
VVRRWVRRELGPAGGARFDAVIGRGADPDPPADAFGPCFTRVPSAVPVFELGFDERRSRAAPPAIRGLVARSAAARAGLVEGDRLVSLDSARLDPTTPAEVTIERAGQPVTLRYLPARAGATRAGFRWVHAAGADAGAGCDPR